MPGGNYPTAPPPPKAEGFQIGEHVGSLLAVTAFSYEPKAQTPWGVREQVIADIVVLAGQKQQGMEFNQVRLSNKKLAPQLAQVLHQQVFGRVVAEATGQANPAVYLGGLNPGDEQIIDSYRASQGRPAQPNVAPYQHQYQREPEWQQAGQNSSQPQQWQPQNVPPQQWQPSNAPSQQSLGENQPPPF
jgi:hypothetical protein